MNIQIIVESCSFGKVLIGSTSKGICAVILGQSIDELCNQFKNIFPSATIESYDSSRNDLIKKTLSVINGKKEDILLDLVGTDFQKKVWAAIYKIASGSTATYTDISRQIDSKAVRAVGTACGKNPIAILIPCHRVIKSNGELGKYRWGAEIKRKLLEREAINENL